MVAQAIQDKPLTSDRQEKFCQIKANEDVSNSEAYRRAGYSHIGADKNSARLRVKDYIKARIQHIRNEIKEILEINKETQAEKYENVRRRCKEEGDNSNEIKALNGLDKLYGLSIDKQQTERTEAQVARTAVERRVDKEFAQWLLMKQKATEQATEAVNEVILDDV